MKESLFFDDEFEKQLKEKSDQFKMYPSDKIWNEVYHSLHTRRKRFVAGMGFLIGGILILAGIQLISPAKNPARVQAVTRPVLQLESASDIDLSAFNPTAFSANPNASGKPAGNHTQNNKSVFLAFPLLAENASGLSIEKQSESRIKSEIGAVSKKDRSAYIILPEMASANNPSLSLKENAPAQKILPDLADISDAVAVSEKSITHPNPMRNDRFSWEIYISPTLNTRHLDGVDYHNISQTIQNAPITVVRFASVNGFVDNTPAMGYDLGGNVLYRLSPNLSLKAGLQFSFSRYYINAYNSSQPQASASLNSYFGYIADSISNNSQGRYVTQKNAQHYQNKYYQLSMPVGIEWKVAGKGRLQFHAGATIQPGYLLNRDAYVLSSDYSSYSKEPAALRKWNFNAGAEIFLSYRLGKIRWELGPMLRYQILSTYKDSYPLKENLMNYGIRLGFSKTIR